MKRIIGRLNRISNQLYRMELAKAFDEVTGRSMKKLIWMNFLVGLARGLGMAIGFTLLGAAVLYVLKFIVKLNLPLIGQFIAEMVKIVQKSL